MFELKPLSKTAIPAALAKAERYRLLNEPSEAESICLDILRIEPDHQQAKVVLLLALSDQFLGEAVDALARAREALHGLHDEYERCYYAGLISERMGKAHLGRATRGGSRSAFEWLREAMDWYERAEAISPQETDDAILRWNTCARILMSNPQLAESTREDERQAPVQLE